MIGILMAAAITGAADNFDPHHLFAPFVDGNSLYTHCQLDRKSCRQYVIGVVDGMDFFAARNGEKSFPYCLPDNATEAQVTDVVVKYLQNNPANRHQQAAFLTMFALETAFPCEK